MSVILGIAMAALLFGLSTLLRARDRAGSTGGSAGGCTGSCVGCTGQRHCETSDDVITEVSHGAKS
jgi:hypothetical protein